MAFYAETPPEENSQGGTKSVGLGLPLPPGPVSTRQPPGSVQTCLPAPQGPKLLPGPHDTGCVVLVPTEGLRVAGPSETESSRPQCRGRA